MSEGFFRSKKGFTVVQNELTKDNTISLKAKGLYLVIQAYITMPDKQWTKDDFLRLAKEGTKAFDSAWKELKDTGYLKVHIMADGGKWRTEYELLDAPMDGPHTFYHNNAGEITSDNIKRAAKKQLSEMAENEDEMKEDKSDDHCPPFGSNGKTTGNHYPLFGSNGKTSDDHYSPYGSNANGTNGFGSNGYGSNGNGGNKKNKDFEIKTVNKNYNKDSYLNPNPKEPLESYPMDFVEDNFRANDLIQMGQNPDDVEMVMEILYDTLNSTKEKMWVNREEKPTAIVKSRLMKLNSMDLEYAISKYKSQTTEIKHHKAYMLSILYDAKGQCHLDFANQVQHDMYGY